MTEPLVYYGVIEWSKDDQCFIGHCPGVIGPCCHGDSYEQVAVDLRQIIGEWLEIEKEDKEEVAQCHKATVSPLIEIHLGNLETMSGTDVLVIDKTLVEEETLQYAPWGYFVDLDEEDDRNLDLWELENQLHEVTSRWPENDVGEVEEIASLVSDSHVERLRIWSRQIKFPESEIVNMVEKKVSLDLRPRKSNQIPDMFHRVMEEA